MVNFSKFGCVALFSMLNMATAQVGLAHGLHSQDVSGKNN